METKELSTFGHSARNNCGLLFSSGDTRQTGWRMLRMIAGCAVTRPRWIKISAGTVAWWLVVFYLVRVPAPPHVLTHQIVTTISPQEMSGS